MYLAGQPTDMAGGLSNEALATCGASQHVSIYAHVRVCHVAGSWAVATASDVHGKKGVMDTGGQVGVMSCLKNAVHVELDIGFRTYPL